MYYNMTNKELLDAYNASAEYDGIGNYNRGA